MADALITAERVFELGLIGIMGVIGFFLKTAWDEMKEVKARLRFLEREAVTKNDFHQPFEPCFIDIKKEMKDIKRDVIGMRKDIMDAFKEAIAHNKN